MSKLRWIFFLRRKILERDGGSVLIRRGATVLQINLISFRVNKKITYPSSRFKCSQTCIKRTKKKWAFKTSDLLKEVQFI